MVAAMKTPASEPPQAPADIKRLQGGRPVVVMGSDPVYRPRIRESGDRPRRRVVADDLPERPVICRKGVPTVAGFNPVTLPTTPACSTPTSPRWP